MSWWLDASDLDDDQKDVIALPPMGGYLILGPPGSGKTNLLLIRAEYLIRTGHPNLFVLMFNDSLHDFVSRGAATYDVPASKIRKTLSWQIYLLREHGVNVDDLGPEEDLDTKRKVLATRVLDLLNGNPNLDKHIDCLLIDEVQDCLPEEIEVFRRVARNVCFAGDSRQRIFNANDVIPALKKDLQVVTLKTHYRIGHEICKAADAVASASGLPLISGDCNYKGETDRVNFLECATDEEQFAEMIKSLNVQLTAYPGELLAVVGPRKADLEKLREVLAGSAIASRVLPHREAGSTNPEQCIYVAHIREIKGLEFRTAHLVLMQHLHKLGENQKRIAYTAITRAKTTLSVYFTGRIPGYLEQARAAVEPPKATPQLQDLFPKKGKAKP